MWEEAKRLINKKNMGDPGFLAQSIRRESWKKEVEEVEEEGAHGLEKGVKKKGIWQHQNLQGLHKSQYQLHKRQF